MFVEFVILSLGYGQSNKNILDMHYSLFFQCNIIQWASDIRTSLDFKRWKRGWVANGPDFEWDLKSGSPTI